MKNFFSVGLLLLAASTFAQQTNQIEETGNVGIGTTTPNSKLEVHGDIALKYGNSLKVHTNWNGNGNDKILQTGWDASRGNFLDLFVPGDGASNDAKISFHQNGKVGIGITQPYEKLDINGVTYLRNGAINETKEQLRLGRLDLNVRYHSVYSHHSTTANNNKLVFKMHTGSTSNATEQTDVMSLNGDGNVGIGTTAPTSKLHLKGTSSTYSAIENTGGNSKLLFGAVTDRNIIYSRKTDNTPQRFRIQVSNENNFVINTDGKVGIGTNHPGTTLQVNNGTLKVSGGSTLSQESARLVVDSGASYAHSLLELRNDNGVVFKTVGDKVGIGTATPSAKLHVLKETVNSHKDQFATSVIEGTDSRLQIISDDSGSNGSSISLTNANSSWTLHQKTSNVNNRFDIGYKSFTGTNDIAGIQDVFLSILKSGNVGIGDTSPGEKLSVNGNIAAKDLISGGSNSWIFHTPDDGRKNLYIAPQKDDNSGWDWSKYLFIQHDGSVGIGGATSLHEFKLGVKGKIVAEEVKVATYANWADFVFKKEYDLPTLEEVATHIKEKGHLKDIPSAKEVEKNGFYLGQMDAKLLQKIEELTLYTIEQEKQIKELKKQTQEIEKLKALVNQLLKEKTK